MGLLARETATVLFPGRFSLRRVSAQRVSTASRFADRAEIACGAGDDDDDDEPRRKQNRAVRLTPANIQCSELRPIIMTTPITVATIDVTGKTVSGPKYANTMNDASILYNPSCKGFGRDRPGADRRGDREPAEVVSSSQADVGEGGDACRADAQQTSRHSTE